MSIHSKKQFFIPLILAFFVISIMVLFHGGGRLSFISFFSTIILYNMLFKGQKVSLSKILLIASVLIFFTAFGKQIFNIFVNPDAFTMRKDVLLNDLVYIPNFLLIEFIFPYVNLANAVVEVGKTIDYRFFIDYFNALLQILPSNLLGIQTPETASITNSMSFGVERGIPLDRLTFAYFSLGIAGVIFSSLLLGFISTILEAMFYKSKNPLVLVFRVNWILLFGFSIMYGDPKEILFRNFYFIIPTILLVLPYLFQKYFFYIRGKEASI